VGLSTRIAAAAVSIVFAQFGLVGLSTRIAAAAVAAVSIVVVVQQIQVLAAACLKPDDRDI
jgi:hypothetical protein